MSDFAKARSRRRANCVQLTGCFSQFRERVCKSPVAPLQRIIIGIADLRRIVLVIGQIRRPQLFFQLQKFCLGILCRQTGHVFFCHFCHARSLFVLPSGDKAPRAPRPAHLTVSMRKPPKQKDPPKGRSLQPVAHIHAPPGCSSFQAPTAMR